MTLLSAILPLMGVMIGVFLQYYFGKTLADRKQLAIQKGQAYADYFRAMAMASTQGYLKEALSLAADAKTRICIYGSPHIVRILAEFERSGAHVTASEHGLISELLKAMRVDMGTAQAGLPEDDLRLVLFGVPSTN
jgi:hypothetical protein